MTNESLLLSLQLVAFKYFIPCGQLPITQQVLRRHIVDLFKYCKPNLRIFILCFQSLTWRRRHAVMCGR